MTRPYSEESAYAHKLIGDPNHAELDRFLDTVGDGSGSKEMNTVANVFRLKPPDGTIFLVERILISGWDNAIASGGTFIGTSALTTGCKLEIREKPGATAESVIQDLTDGIPIKNNGELGTMGRLLITNDAAAVQCLVQCIIEPGAPYRIEGKRGESLVFESQVTLAAILGLRVKAIGRIYTNDGLA
jgi:hypothetical protein